MPTITELIVDAYNCNCNLSDIKLLENGARDALAKAGATVVASAVHPFQPHGATVCLVLKESHFVVSTWPEYRFATVNIFLCNEQMSAEKCWEDYKKVLQCSRDIKKFVTHKIEPNV